MRRSLSFAFAFVAVLVVAALGAVVLLRSGVPAAPIAVAPGPRAPFRHDAPRHVDSFVQLAHGAGRAGGWRALESVLTWVNTGYGGPGSGDFTSMKREAPSLRSVWYQDPHRICVVAEHCSDRPPLRELQPHQDLMQCANLGAPLQTPYNPNTATVYGDPTSARLINATVAYTERAMRMPPSAGGGPVDLLWLDDTILLPDAGADKSCGPAEWRFAGGRTYTNASYLAALQLFNAKMLKPVINEGACNGDGATTGDGDPADPAGVVPVVDAPNSVAEMCEVFAEGYGFPNNKATGHVWESHLNTGLQVQSYRKIFVAWPYYGDPSGKGADPRDNLGYFYASFMLIYDSARSCGGLRPLTSGSGSCSFFKFNAWGAPVGPAEIPFQPIGFLVPLDPLESGAWPARKIAALRRGDVYVREFAGCYFGGASVGPCAAVVNPATRGAAMPPTAYRYAHALRIVNFGAMSGRNGTPNLGDPPDAISLRDAAPTALPAQGWAILLR